MSRCVPARSVSYQLLHKNVISHMNSVLVCVILRDESSVSQYQCTKTTHQQQFYLPGALSPHSSTLGVLLSLQSDNCITVIIEIIPKTYIVRHTLGVTPVGRRSDGESSACVPISMARYPIVACNISSFVHPCLSSSVGCHQFSGNLPGITHPHPGPTAPRRRASQKSRRARDGWVWEKTTFEPDCKSWSMAPPIGSVGFS